MTMQAETWERAPETPGRGSLSLVQMLVILVVGVTVGATTMWGLLFSGLDFATPLVDGFLRFGLPVLGLLAGAVALVLPVVWWVLRRFANRAQGTLDRIVREAAAARRAARTASALPCFV